jgi:uncharacterized protein (UPF0147 family)
MVEKEVQNVIEFLRELSEDMTVPRNIKGKAESTIKILSDTSMELSIRVDKSLSELEEVCDDANIQPYTRTQIWNIVSCLEKLTS